MVLHTKNDRMIKELEPASELLLNVAVKIYNLSDRGGCINETC